MLRATGALREADQLVAEELPEKIDAWRRAVSVPVTDAELQALFAAEEERVADARTLAELLLPLLTQAPAAGAAARHATQPAVAATSASATIGSEAPIAAAASTTTADPAPGIADFIDEMLTQDRAAARPRSGRRSA